MKKTLIALTLALIASASFANGDAPAASINKGGEGIGLGLGIAGSASKSEAIASANQNLVVGATTAQVGVEVGSNTPPVVAAEIPAVPTSCRLYLFGGGATRDGAASGSIPLANDQTCLSIASLNLMERAGGFTQKEKQAVVCKVEGMAEFETCKALASAGK